MLRKQIGLARIFQKLNDRMILKGKVLKILKGNVGSSTKASSRPMKAIERGEPVSPEDFDRPK